LVQNVKDQGIKDHHTLAPRPHYIRGMNAPTKFKFCAQMQYGRLLPIMPECAGVTEYNSVWKIRPTYIIRCQTKTWNVILWHFESAWIFISTDCTF